MAIKKVTSCLGCGGLDGHHKPGCPRTMISVPGKPIFTPQRIRTTSELLDIQAMFAKAGREIITNKNHDYGDSANNDPFANFRRHGALGILVRMDDKLARLTTFVKKGRLSVSDESVNDTALDLMNYSAIFIAFLMDEEERRNEEAAKVMKEDV